MNELQYLIPIIIAVFSGLAFLSVKKYTKFKKLMNPIIYIIYSIIILSLTWNLSATFFRTSLIYNNIEISEELLNEHSFSFIYYYIIPMITFAYIHLLDYIFKPD